jgi:hypothetical protein
VLADYFYIEGDGQVITGTFDVRFPSDVKVLNYVRGEEDTVEPGTPLFRYAVVDETEETGTFSEAAPAPSGVTVYKPKFWVASQLRLL